MIVDKELDEIEFERKNRQAKDDGATTEGVEMPKGEIEPIEDGAMQLSASVGYSQFAEKMEDVKLGILQNASEDDEKFVKTVKDNVKKAAVANTETEKEREEFAKQTVQYEREKLSTKQQRNVHEATEDKWANKEKRREFHYNGVKPIMEFVGISKPMNLFLLYFLSFVLVWFFLLSKLWRGTIGALIAGAEDSDRPRFVKGFLWTLLAVIAVGIVSALVFFFLKWQNII